MNDVGITEHVSQEAESRHDRRVTEVVGCDVHHRDGERVAALCSFDVDRPRQRMDEVEVDRGHVLSLRVEGKIGIERVTRLEHEKLPGLHMGGRLDAVVITIEAVRIVFAVLARLCHDHRRRQLDLAGIGPRPAKTSNQQQGSGRHCANERGFHWFVSPG